MFSAIDVHKGGGMRCATSGGSIGAVVRVSAGFFRMLGVVPALGRDFFDGRGSARKHRDAIITDAAWHSRFGGRPDIVGQTISLSGDPTPSSASCRPLSLRATRRAEFWMPFRATGGCDLRRSCHSLTVSHD